MPRRAPGPRRGVLPALLAPARRRRARGPVADLQARAVLRGRRGAHTDQPVLPGVQGRGHRRGHDREGPGAAPEPDRGVRGHRRRRLLAGPGGSHRGRAGAAPRARAGDPPSGQHGLRGRGSNGPLGVRLRVRVLHRR